MDIPSYMIEPMQKLTKYELLINEYIKNLPREHPDYNALIKARIIYNNVVTKIDQEKENQNYSKRKVQINEKFNKVLLNKG